MLAGFVAPTADFWSQGWTYDYFALAVRLYGTNRLRCRAHTGKENSDGDKHGD